MGKLTPPDSRAVLARSIGNSWDLMGIIRDGERLGNADGGGQMRSGAPDLLGLLIRGSEVRLLPGAPTV